MLFSLTERAAQKVREIAQKQNKPDAALRLRVVGGGCSGMSYEFSLAETVDATDKVIEAANVKVVLDPRSLLYVAGSELDYEQSLMKSGFKVKNPNVTTSCSCGESFNV